MYEYSHFEHQVLDFGFPDHHPPSLTRLCEIIRSLHSYLQSDAKNVAVVHCVGGKGRTGCVVASYLTFAGFCQSPEEALEVFASKRSDISLGVTQPSQRRYVQYFHRLVHAEVGPLRRTLLLSRIVLEHIPAMERRGRGCRPLIEISSVSEGHPGRLLWSNASTLRTVAEDEQAAKWDLCLLLSEDVMVEVFHVKMAEKLTERRFMFRSLFHTAFISLEAGLSLETADLDEAFKDKNFEQQYPEGFKFHLLFHPDVDRAGPGGVDAQLELFSSALPQGEAPALSLAAVRQISSLHIAVGAPHRLPDADHWQPGVEQALEAEDVVGISQLLYQIRARYREALKTQSHPKTDPILLSLLRNTQKFAPELQATLRSVPDINEQAATLRATGRKKRREPQSFQLLFLEDFAALGFRPDVEFAEALFAKYIGAGAEWALDIRPEQRVAVRQALDAGDLLDAFRPIAQSLQTQPTQGVHP
jgi:hypothetical protein